MVFFGVDMEWFFVGVDMKWFFFGAQAWTCKWQGEQTRDARMSPDLERKCQRAAAAAGAGAFGGQKAKAKDPDGARMEYQPDYPS